MARSLAPGVFELTSLGDFGEMKADRDRLRAENDRLRAALQWIADQVDNEDGDLDDIILCANKALAHEQRGST